ncbi:MAG: hypothetical protein WAK17_09055 [Candidatus Nitrosopolaris sp.]|jgi:hypothetical protein
MESGSIIDEQKKQKLEYLLRVKKWNPYCFRHSAITDDSDHLPEHALTKKVRWVMGSKQASRYIKQRMGDELKNKILERYGIKIAPQSQMVSRICGRCNYVNKLESKYCERVGCNYPMTQLALDEIKAAEQTKLQELVNKSNIERDNTIQELQHELKSYNESVKEVFEKVKQGERRQKEEDGRHHILYNMLDKRLPGWKKEYYALLDIGPKPLTKEARNKIEELLEYLQNAKDTGAGLVRE